MPPDELVVNAGFMSCCGLDASRCRCGDLDEVANERDAYDEEERVLVNHGPPLVEKRREATARNARKTEGLLPVGTPLVERT